MFRNMVTSLLKHDRIKTTDAKAKELRRWADHIVTLAKRGDLHARRQAMAIVREKDVVHKIFAEAADRFGSIKGGYTRIVKIGRRPGDAAAMTLVELVSTDGAAPAPRKKRKPTAAETAPEPVAAAQAAAEAPTTATEITAEAAVPETAAADDAAAAAEESSAVAAPAPEADDNAANDAAKTAGDSEK